MLAALDPSYKSLLKGWTVYMPIVSSAGLERALSRLSGIFSSKSAADSLGCPQVER